MALGAKVLAVAAATAAQTEIRMMAGVGFGIPPKETTNANAVTRRAVFEAFTNAGVVTGAPVSVPVDVNTTELLPPLKLVTVLLFTVSTR